jgi:hypothetical protein
MLDAETGETQLINGSKTVRLRIMIKLFQKHSVSQVPGLIRVDESYVTKLLSYFKSR